jgi:tRNA dimethylallyltransferase
VAHFPESENPRSGSKRGDDPGPILVFTGPTASGKSSLALKTAEQFHGAVINCDSMQVYRELRVITARPSAQEENMMPHYLYGVMSAAERCSVGRWLELAVTAIDDVRKAGRLPVIVGGTGMYLKALMEGLAPIPDVPEEAVRAAETVYQDLGGEAFRSQLAAIDSEAANKLPAGDRQRLVRAWAVVEATGRTLGEWQRSVPKTPAVDGEFQVVLMCPERDVLYRRCDARFLQMINSGALEEVRSILDMKLPSELPAMRALGVPELIQFLTDNLTLEEATSKAQQATRNFAKRQLTWFRHQIVPDMTLEKAEGEGYQRVEKLLQTRLP